jgi:hypothetical protein
MEENPMESLSGASLLAALLDTTPARLPEVIPDETQLEQARDMLYEALYCIIEHNSMPANQEANVAIGKVLAVAMMQNRDPQTYPVLADARITRLRLLLTDIVREAGGLPPAPSV